MLSMVRQFNSINDELESWRQLGSFDCPYRLSYLYELIIGGLGTAISGVGSITDGSDHCWIGLAKTKSCFINKCNVDLRCAFSSNWCWVKKQFNQKWRTRVIYFSCILIDRIISYTQIKWKQFIWSESSFESVIQSFIIRYQTQKYR